MVRDTGFPRAVFGLLLFIAVITSAGVLKAAASIVLPLVIAVIVSFALEPIIVTLNQRFKIHWGVGIFLVITLVFVVIVMISLLLASSLRTIAESYPRYEARFMTIYGTIARLFRLDFDVNTSLFTNLWSELRVRNFIQSTAFSFSSSLLAFVKNLFMVSLLMAFFLVELRSFREKIILAAPSDQKEHVEHIMYYVIQQVTKYLSIKFFISVLTGITIFAGTAAVGLNFPIVWGFLAFVLNFIPNFGSIVAGGLTILFAVVQFWPNPAPIIIIAVAVLGVNMVLGIILEPRILGQNLGISPFLILVSLTIWGWIWGFMGMLLAVPMMVILKIVCENFPFLKPISILMGRGESPDSASPPLTNPSV